MSMFSKHDLRGINLSGIIPPAPTEEEIPPEITIAEEPFDLPDGIDLCLARAGALAGRIAEAQAAAAEYETKWRTQSREAAAFREQTLLRAVETLDLLEDVIASFRIGRKRPARAAAKPRKPRADIEPISREAYERLVLVADRFRSEALGSAGVTLVPIEPGDSVDPERDRVIETVSRKRLARGSVAQVVRKAYFDTTTGRYLRKAVVKAVRAKKGRD